MKTFKEFLYKMYWKVIRMSWKVYPLKNAVTKRNAPYAIGITTYLDRYETLFKPFLRQLIKIFPDIEIIVTVNGHYDSTAQLKYLQQITAFTKQFHNVKVIGFEDAQSLSKLWNLLLLNSSSEILFIFNDDLEISPLFRNRMERSGILQERIALINQSWSHFMITKAIVKEVGWFDERFPAIGNEDEDYESRLALKEISYKIFSLRSIRPIVTQPLTYSYGVAVEVINEKYLKSNKVFFDSKWEISGQSREGFHYVRILNAYVKLKEGMETPDYYKV